MIRWKMVYMNKAKNSEYVDQKEARILRLAVEIYIAKHANPTLTEAMDKVRSQEVQARRAIESAKTFVEQWEKERDATI